MELQIYNSISDLPRPDLAIPGLKSLNLSGFRNFTSAKLELNQAKMIILSGPNGSGKTNLLEAVSLLAPGRGLRRAKLEEMLHKPASGNNKATPFPVYSQFNPQNGFAVHAKLFGKYDQVDIGVGWQPPSLRQICRINGSELKSQTLLSEYISVVWLTPLMDRLFHDGASARRKFLDRLIFGFDPAHAGRINGYEQLMRDRLKLLSDDQKQSDVNQTNVWLNALEAQMVERAVAIAAARRVMAQRLDSACRQRRGPFPRAAIALSGTIENELDHFPSLEVEARYATNLRENRALDGASGMTHTGPHRSDIIVTDIDKNQTADLCSTGEQKALLLSIILADVSSQRAEQGTSPLLLLDEVAAHLDPNRRQALYEILLQESGQIWMTGADRNLFDVFKDKGFAKASNYHHYHIENGDIKILHKGE